MSTSETAVHRGNSLNNAIDIVVSPSSAFDRLRQVPGWGWALLIASVLGIIGTLLAMPATLHAIETSMPAQLAASDAITKLPTDQQQKQIATILSVSKVTTQISWLIFPIFVLVVGLIQGLIMTLANAIGRGDGSFKKFFALSITTSVVGMGLGSLVLGLIVLVRGPASFETVSAVQSTLPSLALLAPSAKGGLAGFLGSLNVFYIWGTVLLALGMTRVARIRPPAAWTTSVVMLLLTACLAAWGAARNG